MLPVMRHNEYLYEIPQFSVEKDDVDDFMGQLRAFHGEFSEYFCRQEPRDHFFNYMAGRFSDLERKTAEPIAIRTSGRSPVRAMQRNLSHAVWDEPGILRKYHEMVRAEMGDSDGVLISDESGFVKKGKDSAGVARQYCGAVGKVENCQVGVFAAYASRHGYALVNKRLFIPEKRIGDDYDERRRKCEIPPDTVFRTRPELAAEMLREAYHRQRIPFRYITGDTVYGNSPAFVEAADSCIGITYMLAVTSDTRIWLRPPIVKKKEYRNKGVKRVRETLADGEKRPVAVCDFAKNLSNHFWHRRTVSEGTKGPVMYEFTGRKVTLSKGGLPWKEVRLIVRRSPDNDHTFYISNASPGTRLGTLVWLSGIRWAAEQCFGEIKSELGGDHYEVRKYNGWHRHMLTCIPEHFFLWHIKITSGKKSALTHFAADRNASQDRTADENPFCCGNH